MSKENLKILYDVSLLSAGMSKTSNRSGIFFTIWNVLNILLLRKDVNLTLYTNSNDLKSVRCFLDNEYPHNKFRILTDAIPKIKLYEAIKKYKDKKKLKKQYFRKFFVQLFMIVIALFAKLASRYYKYKKYDFNIFFSSYSEIPNEYKFARSIKKYTILYDVIPVVLPRYEDAINCPDSWFLKLLKSLNKNDYYFSISEYTKQDFIKYCPQLNPEHITTTLLACDDRFRPVSIEQTLRAKEKYNIPSDKKYIFSLCTLEPRKNLIRTVKTFIEFIKKNNIDDLVFVLGGAHWDIFIKQLEDEIEDLDEYKDKIIRAGYIDDEDLAPLYSGAEWFVYTSMYEGFGLPPLEAMSCGCPVITSNNSSLPEVVGDAGFMIDWDSDEQHIEAYEKYYFNENLRKEYAEKGLERAKQFSWKKCVDKMVEVMKNNA